MSYEHAHDGACRTDGGGNCGDCAVELLEIQGISEE